MPVVGGAVTLGKILLRRIYADLVVDLDLLIMSHKVIDDS